MHDTVRNKTVACCWEKNGQESTNYHQKGSHTVLSNIKPVRWVPSPAHSDKTGLLIMVLLRLTDQPTRRTWTPSWIYGVIVKMKMRDSNTTILKLRIKKLAFPWYSTFFRRPWLCEWLFCSIRSIIQHRKIRVVEITGTENCHDVYTVLYCKCMWTF